MIENTYNKKVGDVYKQMLINEAKDTDIIKLVDKWSKAHLNHTTNKKLAKKALDKIKAIVKDSEINTDKIVQITDEFLVISKLIKDDEMGSKMKDELVKILDKVV